MRVTNNVISGMVISIRCLKNEHKADEVAKVVKATTELSGKFNLSDFIWFCKNLDLQGFGKRLKEVHGNFDKMMERIIKENEKVRKKEKDGDGGSAVKALLHILLDISEDKSSEIRLMRENIKAFLLVCKQHSLSTIKFKFLAHSLLCYNINQIIMIRWVPNQ
jgi:hypothetical protein